MDGLMAAWTQGFTVQHPESPARVVRRARYSADFVAALGRGDVRVAPFARELFASERTQLAAALGGAPRLVPVATGSRATKGGTHAIVIFVNARNPLARLSLAQLREVLARDGRIRTWGQLGLTGAWADRPIAVHGMRVRRETGNPPGIVNFLEGRVLAGRGWRDDLDGHVDQPGGAQALDQIVAAVAADETALGYSGFAYTRPGVKAVALGETDAGPFFAGTAEEIARRDYPLARTIYLAVGPAPDAATLEFLAYVRGPEGQGALTRDAEGFFPLPVPAAPPAYEPRPVPVPRAASYLTPDGAVAVIGYNNMAPMLAALTARFTARHPEIRWDLRLHGTRTAPPALARGESVFAPMGAEFSPRELADYRASTGAEPVAFRVAHASLDPAALSGPLAILVPASSPRTAITLAEVADIFSGRAEQGLHPCGLAPETALGLCLRRRLLGGGGFGPSFRGFAQSAEVVQAVASDPRAIGFAAAMRATPGVRVLALAADSHSAPVALTPENLRAGRYPLDRHLLIYARLPLEPVTREFLQLVLSREGQEIIARSPPGYLPLSAAEVEAELAKLE